MRNKVKNWLNTYVADEMGFEENDWFENYDSYDFSNAQLPFYVFMAGEYKGFYQSQSCFMNEEELQDLIRSQLRKYRDNDHRNHWDDILIFDVKNNKTIEPKVIIE